ncbi:alkaline ceramidase [Pieris napi]|uniref:alkaline ceramidase n=1 Tax=Pieris napi TaxID=78633 RepID=UPI001FB93904|nr:alkaline ceramidase [Pieris napi]XP_047525129.1 alkaline ceramidase [Pieris napi]XP_047525138.1 alkaline ceramidase [Pieris napi]
MWSHLERGSSPVDWCESNYSITPMIAEFVNTVSNILFFLLPPVLIHLFQGYAKFFNPAINVLWLLLMVVGLSSAYFHATLSLVGQLLDELAILWVFMAAFATFFPKRYFPSFLGGNRRLLALYASVFSVLSTGFLVMHPKANAFALMTLAVPALVFLCKELKRVKCPRVYRLGLRCVAVSLLAMFCWITDRMFCDAWLYINFPYLHGAWHILIFIASYTALVLYAYFNVSEERPEQKPQLKYWPKNDFELGIPYVTLKHPYKKDNLAI